MSAPFADSVKDEKVISDLDDSDIDDVMQNFDFARVHRAMDAVGWRWAGPGDTRSVPTIDQLKECARRLMEHVAKERGSIGTGGFHANLYEDSTYDRERIGLKFVLENSDIENR